MRVRERSSGTRLNEHGLSILLIAGGMAVILGMAGLGIDLASLYVGRSQAQRAADAAALAGAQTLVSEGCTTGAGPTISSYCEDMARTRAKAVGEANPIAGVRPDIDKKLDISFPSESTNDPQIKVIVGRGTYNGANHGNAMPTFFVKIFGIDSASISATAKAEAFNPSGTDTGVSLSCVKPWLLPNCDPNRPLGPGMGGNQYCTDLIGGYFDYFVTVNSDGTESVTHPGSVFTGGVQGEQMTIKPGDPTSSATAAPGKFWPVFLPAGAVATVCPSCASVNGGGSGPSSASLYEQNIECCNNSALPCEGGLSIQPITGNKVGPTESGVDCLIHQQGTKSNPTGMDIMTLNSTGTPLWTITGGSANPYPGMANTPNIPTSDSIVTIPLYDGHVLCPGNSCPSTTQVNIIGYLQVFIEYEEGDQQGNVLSYIMNVSAANCSGTSGSGSGDVAAGGASPVPVRLIQ